MVGMKDSRLTHPSQSQYPILALIDRFLALIDDRFPALAVPIKISMHEHAMSRGKRRIDASSPSLLSYLRSPKS